MPAGKWTSSSSSESGIITAWYGMNIPNRKKAKTKSAPGKRHFESTNPFSEPSTHERIVAGIASLKLFCMLGESCVHAWRHASSVSVWGNDHACAGSISSSVLKLVTSRT